MTSVQQNSGPQIWAITSGKGGVGKSFASSSLAIALVKMGHRVCLVDFDLTGGNLHTCLGEAPQNEGLFSYWSGKTRDLNSLKFETHFPRLSLIAGLTDFSKSHSWKADDFFADLKNIEADYVLVDLAAGPTPENISVFHYADERVLVTSPEPTSVEKTYRFVEAYLQDQCENNQNPCRLFSDLRTHRSQQITTLYSFRDFLNQQHPSSVAPLDAINERPIRLLVNSSRSHADRDLGLHIRSVMYQYYSVRLDYAGAIDFENAVWQCVRKRHHPLIEQPFTSLLGQFLSVAKYIVHAKKLKAVI